MHVRNHLDKDKKLNINTVFFWSVFSIPGRTVWGPARKLLNNEFLLHQENRNAEFSVKDETLSRETKYSVAAYVKLNGRTYKGEANVFTTLGYQTPDLVDLGLSVKWATFNLGASKPGAE